MIKLVIDNKDKKRFQKLFRFFAEDQCELCLFEEGLKWRNENCNGIVYSGAFKNYPIKNKRKLGIIRNDKKQLRNWFETWKDLGLWTLIEIR